MVSSAHDPRGSWGSRWTFTLAAIGGALGLGNLWRWPVLVENHGGGAFLLAYVGFLVVLAVPLLMAEFMLGRQYRSDPVVTFSQASQQSQLSLRWHWLGRMALLAALLLVSFYAVVGGMALAYVFFAALGEFTNASEQSVAGSFTLLRSDTQTLAAWQLGFLSLVLLVSVRGIHQGLARSLRVVVPLMLVLLLVLLVFAIRVGEPATIMTYLLTIDFAALGWHGLLQAMSQAFYTVGVATGAMLMLGAYMPNSASLRLSAWVLVLVDTLVALLATVFVYSLLHPLDISAGAGFSLLFNALPLALTEITAGNPASAQPMTSLLFVLVVLLAWSSAIIVLEPLVVWLMALSGLSRPLVVTVLLAVVWLVGLGSILSLSGWSQATLLGSGLFAWLNLLAAGLLMPLVGLGIALFLGWARPALLNRQGVLLGYPGFFIWQWLIRWLVPAAMVLLIVNAVWNFYA